MGGKYEAVPGHLAKYLAGGGETVLICHFVSFNWSEEMHFSYLQSSQ